VTSVTLLGLDMVAAWCMVWARQPTRGIHNGNNAHTMPEL